MNTYDGYEIRVSSHLPTRFRSDTTIHLVARERGADPHVILEHRTPGTPTATVRVHSACFTGDVLGSLRCDCGPQLDLALDAVTAAPWGLLVYVVDHEGRGIGLEEKLKAYNLQQIGYDTFTANRLLGHEDDLRSYRGAIASLRLLGVHRLELLSANPYKAAALGVGGLEVTTVRPIVTGAHPANQHYQTNKAERYRPLLAELLGEGVTG